MNERDWLAERFEADRTHLRGVAYRMLGSLSDADDAVQEAWLRSSRADASDVENLTGWLTTIVSRVALDMLRSRDSRREEVLDVQSVDAALREQPALHDATPGDPEREAMMADSVGLALLVVLNTLDPPERLAFVLHDMFAVPFEEIASIVGRSPAATRQLASRARRRVRGGDAAAEKGADVASQREIVDKFVAALRAGDLNAVLTVLDPNVVVHADIVGTDGTMRGVREVHGAEVWAGQAIAFSRGKTAVQVALVDGSVGIILAPFGRLKSALKLTFKGGKIAEVDAVADPERVARLEVANLD
jgi:RNA polymerase sigma-70 factor (ECF subfamily)